MFKRPQGKPISNLSVQEVIVITVVKGKGIEGDPYREVIQYWTTDGELLAVKDSSFK